MLVLTGFVVKSYNSKCMFLTDNLAFRNAARLKMLVEFRTLFGLDAGAIRSTTTWECLETHV